MSIWLPWISLLLFMYFTIYFNKDTSQLLLKPKYVKFDLNK